MASLEAAPLRYSRGGRVILKSLNMRLQEGELVVLLGANGAGKTTLLRLLMGFLTPDGGRALLDGESAISMSPLARARRVAYLPQQRDLAWPARVEDVVALGRFAYGTSLGRLSGGDRAAVSRALEDCELTDMAGRSADTLSGGEQARMHCARVFAAATPLLLADEPTASLDPLHQHRVLRLFRDYVARGSGALLVLHDVALAARYADRLLWLCDGELVADGSVADTLSAELLAQVYGVEAEVRGRDVVIYGERDWRGYGDLCQ